MPRWVLVAIGFAAIGIPAVSVNAQPHLQKINYRNLDGWAQSSHADAYKSFVLSCRELVAHGSGFKSSPLYGGRKSDWTGICKKALRNPGKKPASARKFFEGNFVPIRVFDPERPLGLFTGYYEPEVPGRKKPGSGYDVPLFAKPDDLVTFGKKQRAIAGVKFGRLVNGKPHKYFSRKQIELGALTGRGLELIWLKSWADAFFMQVQGSGRIRLPDGTSVRLGYAGKSGLPYTAIGAVLIKSGEVAREKMSMQAIRSWMVRYPAKARQLMWHNKSYVFFRKIIAANNELGPIGAQNVQLQPMRSLAIDRKFWALGTPMWLETKLPATKNSQPQKFNQLMIAQDTGSAIKGRVRGDIFFGAGTKAGLLAGKMQGSGKLSALLPKTLAARLGLGN